MEKRKREQTAREALEKLLLPEEELLGIGEFVEQTSFAKSIFLPTAVNVLEQRQYWVGVTQERVIFIPIDMSAMPSESEHYALARADVVYKSLMLTVILPNSPDVQKLQPNFGFKRISGFDEIAFRAAMNSTQPNK